MAATAVIAFAQRMETDEALRKSVLEISAGDPVRTLTEVTRIAAAAGFVFTPAELAASLQEQRSSELPEAALDAVSGGTAAADTGKDPASSGAQVAQGLSNMSKHDMQMTPVRNLRG